MTPFRMSVNPIVLLKPNFTPHAHHKWPGNMHVPIKGPTEDNIIRLPSMPTLTTPSLAKNALPLNHKPHLHV